MIHSKPFKKYAKIKIKTNVGESLYMCVCVCVCVCVYKGGKKNDDLTISFKHATMTNRIQDIGI